MGCDESKQKKYNCSKVPSIVSTFVDTLVDYVVGRQFFHSQQDKVHILRSDPPLALPTAKRLIAIGDMHGDLNKAKEALLIAHVMDANEKWIGGETVVVQIGDLLDRGSGEIRIIYLLEKLKRAAKRQGGDVHIFLGNHEVMNAEGDFRFTTQGGVDEFKQWGDWYKRGNILKQRCKGLEKPIDYFWSIPQDHPEGWKERIAALRPGGAISSRFLSHHPVVLIVGGTVFVHGGLLPQHIRYGLEDTNEETREWLEGRAAWRGPTILHGENAPVWLRKYSDPNENMCDCETLRKVLAAIDGAKRMVVGHTIQTNVGINSVCSNQVVRVDVGMSSGCGDYAPEVLEIQDDQVMTVLSAETPFDPMNMPALMPSIPAVEVPVFTPIIPCQTFQQCVLPPNRFQCQGYASTLREISSQALSPTQTLFPNPPLVPSPTSPPRPPPLDSLTLPQFRIQRKIL